MHAHDAQTLSSRAPNVGKSLFGIKKKLIEFSYTHYFGCCYTAFKLLFFFFIHEFHKPKCVTTTLAETTVNIQKSNRKIKRKPIYLPAITMCRNVAKVANTVSTFLVSNAFLIGRMSWGMTGSTCVKKKIIIVCVGFQV